MGASTIESSAPHAAVRRNRIIIVAFAAFAIANLIHNGGGLDPAIVPAVVLLAAYLWRPRPVLLWATAVMIALPSFMFVKWTALTDASNVRSFANHVALATAALLAVLAPFTPSLTNRRSTSSQTG